MRIAFLGKGGSGKTSIAAGYIQYLSAYHRLPVLAIDADHNTHLHHALQLNRPLASLSSIWLELTKYVRGARTDLFQDIIIGTTPPCSNSNFFRLSNPVRLLENISIKRGNLQFIEVGSFDKSDVGHNCYHGKLEGLNLFLSHLLDQDDERVVVDSTAGLDSFGTPLLNAYDLFVVVVEPTLKSLEVYLQIRTLVKKDKLVVLGNKIENQADLKFLKENIGDFFIGKIEDSSHLRRFEQGDLKSFENFVNEHTEIWKMIEKQVSTKVRDWEGYFDNQLKIHNKVSRRWYNNYYRAELEKYLDKNFRYKDVIL